MWIFLIKFCFPHFYIMQIIVSLNLKTWYLKLVTIYTPILTEITWHLISLHSKSSNKSSFLPVTHEFRDENLHLNLVQRLSWSYYFEDEWMVEDGWISSQKLYHTFHLTKGLQSQNSNFPDRGKLILDIKRNFFTEKVVKHWNRIPNATSPGSI